MSKRYYIVLGSPIDYEELVAYINIDGQDVAILHQEQGVEKLKLEFFPAMKKNGIEVELFLDALHDARKKLIGT